MSIQFQSSVLFTADIKRLSAFYIEVLGQEVQHDFAACIILRTELLNFFARLADSVIAIPCSLRYKADTIVNSTDFLCFLE